MTAQPTTTVGTMSCTITVGGTRVYRVKYQVLTDVTDQALAAILAPGMPTIGTYYNVGDSTDYGAFVESYETSLTDADGSRKVWDVIVTYTTRPHHADNTAYPVTSWDFPWLAPPRISGGGTKVEVPARTHYVNPSDISSVVPLRNSVGEIVDDEFKERSALTLTIQKAYEINKWSIEGTGAYVDHVNENTFWAAEQDYYKLAAPRYQLLYTGAGIPYWDVTYDFEGQRGGWNGIDKIDEGKQYIDTSTNTLRRFDDDWKQPISGKGKLDGTGHRIGYPELLDESVNYPPNGMNKYLRADYAGLGIPTSASEVYSG